MPNIYFIYALNELREVIIIFNHRWIVSKLKPKSILRKKVEERCVAVLNTPLLLVKM